MHAHIGTLSKHKPFSTKIINIHIVHFFIMYYIFYHIKIPTKNCQDSYVNKHDNHRTCRQQYIAAIYNSTS